MLILKTDILFVFNCPVCVINSINNFSVKFKCARAHIPQRMFMPTSLALASFGVFPNGALASAQTKKQKKDTIRYIQLRLTVLRTYFVNEYKALLLFT